MKIKSLDSVIEALGAVTIVILTVVIGLGFLLFPVVGPVASLAIYPNLLPDKSENYHVGLSGLHFIFQGLFYGVLYLITHYELVIKLIPDGGG